MKLRTKAILVVLGVFLAGAVGGSALTLHLVARRLSGLFEGIPKHTLARLYGEELGRRLHLSAEQRAEVERIVNDDHTELARVGQSLYPELSDMRRKRHGRIREILAPEQRAAFDALVDENERRRRAEIDLPP